ncbi:AraC-like DNA-binding protein [Dysgonomonadaceae bacterium PH5-43]|nr:AraC-like DNA-binding protein [Dysgonomonadaceae bacterium PH5-43]
MHIFSNQMIHIVNPGIFPQFTMSLPIITAFTCIAMLLLFNKKGKDKHSKDLHFSLLLFYIFIIFNWTYGLLYIYKADILTNLNSLIYFTYLAVQVALYRFTYIITRLSNDKNFSWVHYIIPIAVLLITTVWSFFIPENERLFAGLYIEENNSRYPAYHIWINTRYILRFILSGGYAALSVWRIIRYRREIVSYSANTDTNSYNWLMLVVLLTIPMLLIPISVSFINPRFILSSIFWALPSLLIALQMTLLCYFTITNYYVIIENTPKEEDYEDDDVEAKNWSKSNKRTKRQINKKDFEKYIIQKKPYLNPELKITDLCADLATNRSYLSSFINKEYGMNFNRYINQLRLKEVRSYRVDPRYSDDRIMEFILQAGFSSYQSYLYTLKMEEKNSLILR